MRDRHIDTRIHIMPEPGDVEWYANPVAPRLSGFAFRTSRTEVLVTAGTPAESRSLAADLRGIAARLDAHAGKLENEADLRRLTHARATP